MGVKKVFSNIRNSAIIGYAMKTFAFLACLALVLVTCHPETEELVPERTVFKCFITLEGATQDGEYRVVLKDDSTGELVDSRKIPIGQEVTFDSRKKLAGGKLAITIVFSVPTYVSLKVYTGIPVGSKWTVGGDNVVVLDPGQMKGQFTVIVDDVPGVRAYSVSDKYGQHGDTGYSYGSTLVGRHYALYNQSLKQLVAVNAGGIPRYQILTEVSPGSTFLFAYNTMTVFPKTFQITFPYSSSILGTVMGYEGTPSTANSYTVYDNTKWPSGQKGASLTIGLLDIFTNYKIDLEIGSFHYHSLGPLPSSIKYIPPGNFKISNRAMTNFLINTTESYSYSKSRYGAVGFDIEYISPAGQQIRVDPLTEELAEQFGFIADDIKYFSTDIYMLESYSDYLSNTFDAPQDPSRPYTRASVRIIE